MFASHSMAPRDVLPQGGNPKLGTLVGGAQNQMLRPSRHAAAMAQKASQLSPRDSTLIPRFRAGRVQRRCSARSAAARAPSVCFEEKARSESHGPSGAGPSLSSPGGTRDTKKETTGGVLDLAARHEHPRATGLARPPPGIEELFPLPRCAAGGSMFCCRNAHEPDWWDLYSPTRAMCRAHYAAAVQNVLPQKATTLHPSRRIPHSHGWDWPDSQVPTPGEQTTQIRAVRGGRSNEKKCPNCGRGWRPNSKARSGRLQSWFRHLSLLEPLV